MSSSLGGATASREYHTATLLRDGRVLVTDGTHYEPDIDRKLGQVLSSAELYDPRTGGWTAACHMATARAGHTATLLPIGKVLIVGGCYCLGAEVYDPRTGRWSPTGRMLAPRRQHTATLLPNGQVLVAGGLTTATIPSVSAEVYDPRTNQWRATGRMTSARYSHTATLLSNGRVLVAGGCNAGPSDCGATLASAELYDVRTGHWTPATGMIQARQMHTATLLRNGKVLVTGACCENHPSRIGSRIGPPAALSDAELYTQSTGP